ATEGLLPYVDNRRGKHRKQTLDMDVQHCGLAGSHPTLAVGFLPLANSLCWQAC
uniref:Uncharacterized protein n=1 Tax=Oryza brachyantha TaxID=4533 RepID=J3LBB4_ORYBR